MSWLCNGLIGRYEVIRPVAYFSDLIFSSREYKLFLPPSMKWTKIETSFFSISPPKYQPVTLYEIDQFIIETGSSDNIVIMLLQCDYEVSIYAVP